MEKEGEASVNSNLDKVVSNPLERFAPYIEHTRGFMRHNGKFFSGKLESRPKSDNHGISPGAA